MKKIPKVGSRVIVKDIPVGTYNDVHFTYGMREHVGKEFIIDRHFNTVEYDTSCRLADVETGKDIGWHWYPWMLKKVKPSVETRIDAALDDFATDMLKSDGSLSSVEWLEKYRKEKKDAV